MRQGRTKSPDPGASAAGFLTLALVSLVMLLLAQPLWSQSRDMLRAPTPDWVVAVDLPLPDPERHEDTWDGVHYRLVDRQIRWEGRNRHFYDRVAIEVLERAGLEESARITRDFDPEFEVLTLHHILIHRGNQLIDVTAQTSYQVMRRETDLGVGLLDGTLTSYLEVADLRVGDVIDIAFSWEEAPRLPGSFIDLNVAMNWSVPVTETHLRVHWPAGLPMFERITAEGLKHRAQTSGDATVHTWVGHNLMSDDDEDDMPAWHLTQGTVSLSALKDWQPVAAALLDYYGTAPALPAAFEAPVAAIAARFDTPSARAAAALRLVQDKIRYVGIEIGDGAYFARPPELVVARGYGDCKDKAVLLHAVLARLGIPAHVALANLDQGRALKEWLPSPFAFDHMIVGANVGGQTLWLDPTDSYQGGADGDLAPPDHGYVLPILPGQRGLELITIERFKTPDLSIVETFTFQPDAILLDVRSDYRRRSADNMRYRLATQARAVRFADYLGYYQDLYWGMELRDTSAVADDVEGNLLSLHEAYLVPKEKLNDDALLEEFTFRAADLILGFSEANLSARQHPLYQPWPVKREHVVRIQNPPIDMQLPSDTIINNPHFRFAATSALKDGVVELRWLIESRSAEVPAGDAARYQRDLDRARENLSLVWDFRDSAPAWRTKLEAAQRPSQ